MEFAMVDMKHEVYPLAVRAEALVIVPNVEAQELA